MFFSTRTTLAALTTALFAISGVRADDCSDGPMDGFRSWGKPDPANQISYCHTKWRAGLVVSGIEVWSTNYHVAGLQFTFSDGSKYDVLGSTIFGTNKGENNMDDNGGWRHASIQWDPKSKIDVFKLQTSQDGNAVGMVHIEVEGKKLQVSSNGMGDGDYMNLGSGILLGASGTHSSFLGSMTPLFLGGSNTPGQIISIALDDNLDDMNKRQQGLQYMNFNQMFIQNTNPTGGPEQDWEFAGQLTQAAQTTLSVTDTSGFSLSESIEVSASVDIPEVASVSVSSTTTAGWEMQKATYSGLTTTAQAAPSWKQSSPANSGLKPGHAQNCTATGIMGSYDGGFTSTVKITVAGKDYTYQQRGNLKGISYSNVYTTCQDMLIKDIPQGSKTQTASDSLKSKKTKRVARSFAA